MSNFETTDFLNKSIQNKDRRRIIGALMGYLNVDLYFKTGNFINAINYTKSKGITEDFLFEKLKDEGNIKGKSEWDEKYYITARNALEANFCIKRIIHVIEVGKHLGSKKSTSSTTTQTGGNKNKKGGGGDKHGKKPLVPVILALVAAVVLVILLIALFKKNQL